MSELKTQPNDTDVGHFLDGIENERRRQEGHLLLRLMRRVTGQEARMWGTSITGFGSYHYRYDSGREGDWFLTGFSPRKQAMAVYIMPGFGSHDALTIKLGKHRTGKSCLYVNRLDDIDLAVLEDLVARSVAWMRETYGT